MMSLLLLPAYIVTFTICVGFCVVSYNSVYIGSAVDIFKVNYYGSNVSSDITSIDAPFS